MLETPERARVYVATGTCRQIPHDETGSHLVHARYFEIDYRLDGQGGWGRAESVRSVGEDDTYEPSASVDERIATNSWKPGSGPAVPRGFSPYRIKETADGTAILAASGRGDWVVADRQGEHRMPDLTDMEPTTWDPEQHTIAFSGYSNLHPMEGPSTQPWATHPLHGYFMLVWDYQLGSLRLYQFAVADGLSRLAH